MIVVVPLLRDKEVHQDVHIQIHPTQHLLQRGDTMSSTTTRQKFGRGAAIGGLGIAALIVVNSVIPSLATFNDVDTARVDINTATVVLGVSDVDNSATIDLDFNNLAPGQVIGETFYIKNDGSIPAVASIGTGFTNSTPANPALNYNELRVGVGTTSGQIALTSVTNLPASFNLGVIQPGETKAFVFDVKLGGTAGNEWQGQTFGGNIPVTLTQQ